jgi:HPt (histidine-containing phosphotransfer) domain-containing protein
MADPKIDLGEMQRQVDDLGARINSLQQRVKTGTNREQQAREELATLVARHRELSAAMTAARGGDAKPEHQSMVHKLAGDLDASIGKFTDWVDAEEHPGARPGGFSP